MTQFQGAVAVQKVPIGVLRRVLLRLLVCSATEPVGHAACSLRILLGLS